MALQQWEVTPYEQAARQLCARLNEDQNEMLMDSNGTWYPRWMSYALRMAELHLMIRTMIEHGFEA